MRSLTLTNVYGDVQDHLQLIAQCKLSKLPFILSSFLFKHLRRLFLIGPQLTKLIWRTLSKSFPALELVSFLTRCQFVSRLSLLDLSHSHIPDRDFATLISVMPKTVERLNFASSYFGSECARAISTQLSANPPLSLDIRSCLYATSSVVQDLMSSCLNPSPLWADVVDVGDMDKGSWVCY